MNLSTVVWLLGSETVADTDNKYLPNLRAWHSSITFIHAQNIEVITPNTMHGNCDTCQNVTF